MHLLQSTLRPAPGQPASLYLKLSSRAGAGALRFRKDATEVGANRDLGLLLDRGETLSTDTMLGSFYTGFWGAHTTLGQLALVVEFRGRGEIRVFEDTGDEAVATLLSRHDLESPTGQKFLVNFSPAGLKTGIGRPSRIHVELQASRPSELHAMDFVTEEAPRQAVSLSIGIAAQRDVKSQTASLLDAMLRLTAEEPAVQAIYLAGMDQDVALPTGHDKMHRLPPAAPDAPGGLAQTLAAALGAAAPASHHLLLTDDLLLDERLVPRALQFLRYARGPMALGGSLLDAQAPTVLVGAGGVITASGQFGQLGAGLDVTELDALAQFTTPMQIDLPCWWYCLLPLAQAAQVPLFPGPCLRGDDYAHLQSLQALGVTTACLPQIAAWRQRALTLPHSEANTVELGNRYLPPHRPLSLADHARTRAGSLNLLQSTLFPGVGLPEPMYLRITPPRPVGGLVPRITPGGGQAIRLDAEDMLSTDTFFGGFYRAYWHAYAGLSDVAVAVELSGVASVKVFEDHGRGVSVLAEMSLRSAQPQRFLMDIVAARLTRIAGQTEDRPSRLFVEVTAEGPTDLYSIDFVTWAPPRRQATLSIGLCTFNQETYFARTLTRVAQLARDSAAIRAVHVVNQGAPFQSQIIRDLLASPKIQLVDQRNLGGCGGFTRSLVEELAAAEPASHHLMMDDDIVLDERMISRALRFLDYADREIALGAGMLDSMRPTVMYEAGAYLRNDNTIHPYCHNVDLADPGKLWYFNTPVKTDYNAWWFCILPVETSRKLGLPAPVFIRGDDFEYGQRLAKAGVPTVTLPAIGVWHEPFYAKPTGWQNYYDLRNRLIFGATYGERVRQLSVAHVVGLITTAILTHNYMTAELRLRAVQDFLRGPQLLFADDPEVIHKRVMALAKTDAPEKLDDGWKLIKPSEGRKQASSMRGLALGQLRALLRNGFGPLSRGSVDVYLDADAHPVNTAGRAYILTNGPRSFHLRFVPKRGRMWMLMLRTLAVTLKYRSARNRVGADWARNIANYREPGWWEPVFKGQTKG